MSDSRKMRWFSAIEASTSPLFRFARYKRPVPNTVLKMGENIRVGRTSHFEMSKPETRPISVMLCHYDTGTVLALWVPAILFDTHYSGRNAVFLDVAGGLLATNRVAHLYTVPGEYPSKLTANPGPEGISKCVLSRDETHHISMTRIA